MSDTTASLQNEVTRSTGRSRSPFSKGSVLAIVLVGFVAFLAMLYFIGAGDTGGESGNRNAHASSNALHGYAGLVSLLEANGYEVERSRELGGLETPDLLILTPTRFTEAGEFAQILEKRQYLGPTLVIVPKWLATRPQGEIAEEDEDRVQDDWVQLNTVIKPSWMEELPEPYAMTIVQSTPEGSQVSSRWGGLGLEGERPSVVPSFAHKDPDHLPLVIDPSGRSLAVNVIGQEGTYFYDEAHALTIVAEPDLVNNFGLADPARAALALKLVDQAGYNEKRVTFDLTLAGIGGSINLLTLAFQPPFLAATLCLILAMLIVGWRAMLRFGPVVARSDENSFGKTQLVKNGAGLIVRARRLRLLAAPYAALAQRRIGKALGLSNPDVQAIDAALGQRMPDEEPFSIRVNRMRNARRAGELVRAAQSLNDLVSKTIGKSIR